MTYYPVNLDVKNKVCLVVGGGRVGARKAATLLECGAVTRVISPRFSPDFAALEEQGADLIKKGYSSEDLSGVFLVIGATDNRDLNSRISDDAREKNILCNIVDQAEKSSFILPSTVRRGDLVIAISTAGKSPALAKVLRERLEKEFGPEYEQFLWLMGEIRRRLLAEAHDPDRHREIFRGLIEKGLLSAIQENDEQRRDRILSDVLGRGYSFDTLTSGGGNVGK